MTQQGNQEVGEGGESRIVVLGGSFSQIHKGHIELLKSALNISKRLKIGLVFDPGNKPFKELIEDYQTRYNKLRKAILELDKEADFEIVPIYDPYGPSISEPNLTDIVCTEETLPRAIEINEIRKKKGLKPLNVHYITLALAEDFLPIRSSRIRAGQIDENGKLLVKEVKIIYDE
jgi:pantetheine-phosphate adenylyltransferase